MTFSQYDLATGALTGRSVFCTKPDFVPPQREGFGWVEGRHDHTLFRVDVDADPVEVVPV